MPKATEMRATIEKGIRRATWDELGTVEQDDRAVSRHLERVLSIPYVDVAGIRKRKFKVALDCVRGAGSIIVPQLLERLGCTVNAIHMEPDGRFPRSPEPTADNLKELEQLVLRHGLGRWPRRRSRRRSPGARFERGKGNWRRLHAGAGGAARTQAPKRAARDQPVHEPAARGRRPARPASRSSGLRSAK